MILRFFDFYAAKLVGPVFDVDQFMTRVECSKLGIDRVEVVLKNNYQPKSNIKGRRAYKH
jgi:hypothetical protein